MIPEDEARALFASVALFGCGFTDRAMKGWSAGYELADEIEDLRAWAGGKAAAP